MQHFQSIVMPEI